MGWHQRKKSFNNLKSNLVTPEPSGHSIGRFEHPNPEEAEENNFKCNFMRMMETFKEEMKNSLKEIEEKTNKNWKNSTNLSKKHKKAKKKTNR